MIAPTAQGGDKCEEKRCSKFGFFPAFRMARSARCVTKLAWPERERRRVVNKLLLGLRPCHNMLDFEQSKPEIRKNNFVFLFLKKKELKEKRDMAGARTGAG